MNSKNKLVLAYSGGLDTSYCAVHLSQDLDYEVHAVSVNTGGFTQNEIQAIEAKAYKMGVSVYKNIEAGMSQLIFRQMLFRLRMDKFFLSLIYLMQVSALRLILEFQFHVLGVMRKLKQ